MLNCAIDVKSLPPESLHVVGRDPEKTSNWTLGENEPKQTQSLPPHLNIKVALNFTRRRFLKLFDSYFQTMRGDLFEAGQLPALLLTFVDILPDEFFENLRLFY